MINYCKSVQTDNKIPPHQTTYHPTRKGTIQPHDTIPSNKKPPTKQCYIIKGIGIIKYLPKFLPIKTRTQMYKALVRSHLDYCDTIYHIPALNSQINLGVTLNSLMEKVERTQYQAALAITGTWQGTNRYKLYEELGWESLSDRRWCRRILQVHKIEKYITPYLRDKLPPHRRHLYRFNNSNTFQ